MKPLIVILMLTVFSCQTKTTITHSLTSPTLISIEPDSLAIEQLSQKWGEEDFFTIVDDISWYQSQLMMHVDSMAIDQIATTNRNLKFKGAGQEWHINMDTTDVKWRYIYFDGKKFIEKDAISMLEYLSKNN